MQLMKVVLFIDANQYLDLYRLIAGGKKLLDSLEEQKAHIFVSAPIVDEVMRGKLDCARNLFSDKLKEIHSAVPDYLLGISDDKTAEFKNTFDQAKTASTELAKFAGDALAQISRSDDDVSERLKGLLDKAISPSASEMQRARERKEKGNPPGKPRDPLGDQVTWEQLLTYCKEMKTERLWIITKDNDFYTRWDKRLLLNSLLTRDLRDACGAAPEIHCFSDLLEGIIDFGKNAGVKAEKLPTEAESAEIKQEIEALPPIGWSTGTDDAAMAVIRNHQLRQQAFIAKIGTGFASFPLVSLTEKKPKE
jgi:hypothetical protein